MYKVEPNLVFQFSGDRESETRGSGFGEGGGFNTRS